MHINIDVTEVQKVISAYQAALNSFCLEYRTDHSAEDVAKAEDYFSLIVQQFGLSQDPFDQARRVLRGEATEADS